MATVGEISEEGALRLAPGGSSEQKPPNTGFLCACRSMYGRESPFTSNTLSEDMDYNLVNRADKSTGTLPSVLRAEIEAWVELCLERSREASGVQTWGTTQAAKEKLR